MDLELMKILPHPFNQSAFTKTRIAFSTSRKIYLYDFIDNQELSLIDQVVVSNVDVFEFNEKGDMLYILNTAGKFFVYDINSKKLTYIKNDFLDECFGNILVMDNFKCLWCSNNILFEYCNKEKRIIKIFKSSYTLKSILGLSNEFVYLTAFNDDILYIIKFSLIDMSIVDTVKIKGYHKISKVWYSQDSEKFFIIKGSKLMYLENSNDFKNENVEVKIVCKLKDLKNAIYFKESQNRNLIAFSSFNSLTVLNISKKISEVLLQTTNKSKVYIRNITFAFEDRYIGVSYDNFDYGGKTYFYKCIDSTGDGSLCSVKT